MFVEKTWTGLPNGSSIGTGWVVTAGTNSGFQVLSGQLATIDTGTTLARWATPTATPGEAYAEWKVGAVTSTDEVYVGLATDVSSGTDLAHDAVYVRVTGGLIRLYRKTANSTSLTAIGVSAGNISYTPAAGDLIRLTVHGGNISYSVNGVTKYTFAYTAAPLANYIYPALRARQAQPTTMRVDRFKAADYGVESAPGGGGATSLMTGAIVKTKAGDALKYLGIWSASKTLIQQPLKFMGAKVAAVPMARLSTQGPDPSMQNPPALPAEFTPLRTVPVTNTATLAAACSDARPGDLITLAPGTYVGQKVILSNVKGTAQNPVVIRGPREAVIQLGSGTGYGSGYAVTVDTCDYAWLMGFTVTQAPKGVMTDVSTHLWVKGLRVYNIEQEGVHLRNFTTDSVVEDCTISDTGKKSQGFGEGLYNGTAKSNLTASTSRTGGAPDACDRNVFRRNHVYNMTAEALDMKEGSSNTLVEYNWWEGGALNDYNSAVSWVSCKSNDSIIQYNYGDTTYESAYIVYNPTAGVDGLRNVFRGNTGNCYTRTGQSLPGPAIEDKVGSGSGTVVYSDNTFRFIDSLANVTVTPV